MPAWPNRSSSAADQCGSTVEHMTKVLPGFMAAAAPPAPNSTDSVCAASTTTLTTTPQAAPPAPPPPPPGPRLWGGFVGGDPPRRSEARPHARPQIAHMHCIAVGTQRLCDACAHGAQADDSCFSHGAGCLSG